MRCRRVFTAGWDSLPPFGMGVWAERVRQKNNSGAAAQQDTPAKVLHRNTILSMEKSMTENQRKLAVLIDGENVSRGTIETIMSAVEEMGQPIVKRIYADWTNPHNINWKNVILRYAISPVQQFNYTPGKNSSDFALLLDALEIASDGKVQGFCIVTSDADFTPLVIRLRQAGMFVAGIGERKSHRSFVTACDEFIYTDEGPAAPQPTVTRAPAAARTPRTGIWNHASREHREPASVAYSDAPTLLREPAPAPAPAPAPIPRAVEPRAEYKPRLVSQPAQPVAPAAQPPREETKLPVNFHPMLVQSLSTGKAPAPAPAAPAPVRSAFHAPTAQELLEASKAVAEPAKAPVKAAQPAPAAPKAAKAPEKPAKAPEKTAETMEELLQVVADIIGEAHDADGWTTLTRVDSDIHKKLPGFDTKQFNYNRLITLLKSSATLEIDMRNPNGGGMAYYIRIAQAGKEETPVEVPAVKAEEKPAEAPEEKPAPKAKPRRAVKKPSPEKSAEEKSAAEKPVEAKKPAAKKPAVKKPADGEKKPAAKKPAAKKSEPAGETAGEAAEPVKKPAAKRSHHAKAKPAAQAEEKPAQPAETEKQ